MTEKEKQQYKTVNKAQLSNGEIRYYEDTFAREKVEYVENVVNNISVEFDKKQDKLIPGENITIENNVISAKGVKDYSELDNLPTLNGNIIVGELSSSDLGIATKTSELINDGDDGIHPFIDTEDLNVSLDTKQDSLTSNNAGNGIEISHDSEGNVIISSTKNLIAGHGINIEQSSEGDIISSITLWGDILGNVEDNQTLVNYINENGGKIDSIYVNGIELSINSDKSVDIHVPTETSELENTSWFITNTVNDLVNYYLKSETYTKEEVEQLISQISVLDIKIVDELPTENIQPRTIYFVPAETSEHDNIYNEYIYVDNHWELIGTTKTDLSDYYTKSEVNSILSSYYESSEIDNLLSNKVDSSELDSYYTKTETDNILSNYYESSEVDILLSTKLDSSEIDNYYDKQEIDDLLHNYYESSEIDVLLAEKVDSSELDNYYTRDETDTILSNYYESSEIDELLADKVDSSELDNYYTKTETDTILDNYYESSEIDSLLDEKVDKTDLEDYYSKEEVNDLLDEKQDLLIPGSNIDISSEGIISAIIPIKTSDLTNDGEDGISKFATEAYVDEYGGKIDSISVNGVEQSIDSSKNVDIIVPTNLSDLTNDDNYVQDANYVHTDNNFTDTLKDKLDNIEANADVNIIESISVNNISQTVDQNKNVNITIPTHTSDLVNDGNGSSENDPFVTESITDALSTRIDNIVAQGGEPNVIEIVKENGVALTVDENKAVNVTVPTKTSDLINDGDGNSSESQFVTTDYLGDNNYVQDSNYVHTDNNYTDDDKNKLSNIESGAEVNVIEVIKKNGIILQVDSSEKSVDILVPTTVSELLDSSEYVTQEELQNAIDAVELVAGNGITIDTGSESNVISIEEWVVFDCGTSTLGV